MSIFSFLRTVDLTLGTHCPMCNQEAELRHSHTRNTWENFIEGTGLFTFYRCQKCNKRKVLLSVKLTKYWYLALLSYLLFLGIVSSVIILMN